MKKFKFKINGNPYEVNILNVDDNLADVDVNGTIYKVELEKDILMQKTPKLVRTDSVPSTDIHPSIAKTSPPQSQVIVEPVSVPAPIPSPASANISKGGILVKSPLPGIILDIRVKPGDYVKIGTRLLVLEAMKMENNIDSDKEGKIVSVSVSKGDSVMEGDTLLIIE